ncbi:MAG: SIMPL domain-containing protein [Gemmatimonadales bacterium]|nr:MAG: SIMPL domain-containing protein [Gemmatimonadales bacterium]
MKKLEPMITGAVILAAGLAAAGWLAGAGLAASRAADRYVTVKGIAEREAQADLALWPLRLVVSDNDLNRAYSRLSTQLQQVRVFLAKQGIDTALVELQAFSVNDATTNQYRESAAITRYVINQTLMVRSSDPAKVLAASQKVGELVQTGVVFSSGAQYGGGGPTFVFSGLNDLKPQMIAEATSRAREAADQFATDSKSHLGGIRRANQGVFEILARDQAPGISEQGQISKRVRIVSTVEYFLKD